MPMSQGPQCLMSVIGERSNSTALTSSNSFSSMSSSDMWQPKQPASEQVATLSFFGSVTLRPFHARHRHLGDVVVVVEPLADRHGEAVALADDGAGRADLGGAVGHRQVGVGQAPARN
jgi:hypothetical protein